MKLMGKTKFASLSLDSWALILHSTGETWKPAWPVGCVRLSSDLFTGQAETRGLGGGKPGQESRSLRAELNGEEDEEGLLKGPGCRRDLPPPTHTHAHAHTHTHTREHMHPVK